MAHPKFGDIFEIAFNTGFAYGIYTHKVPQFGSLVRIFEGIHETSLSDFGDFDQRDVQFSAFFPLGAAARRKLVRIAGWIPVPEKLKAFPMFRDGVANLLTKKVKNWWLWDGHREWCVGDITKEQRAFPLREVWNDTLLRERIEQGWRPLTDPR